MGMEFVIRKLIAYVKRDSKEKIVQKVHVKITATTTEFVKIKNVNVLLDFKALNANTLHVQTSVPPTVFVIMEFAFVTKNIKETIAHKKCVWDHVWAMEIA